MAPGQIGLAGLRPVPCRTEVGRARGDRQHRRSRFDQAAARGLVKRPRPGCRRPERSPIRDNLHVSQGSTRPRKEIAARSSTDSSPKLPGGTSPSSSIADAELPKAKSADWSKARNAGFADSGVWRGKPDPAPSGKAALAVEAITLDSNKDNVQRVYLSRADVGRALVVLGKSNSALGGQPLRLSVIDLSTGRVASTAEVPAILESAAFCGDAARAAFLDAKDHRRIEVYEVAGGKHVAGWRPYDNEAGEASSVAWIGFLDRDRLLTLSKTGRLALWSLPECRAIYQALITRDARPILSPGGKQLAMLAGGSIRLLDAAEGKLLGTFEAPLSNGQKLELKGGAFRPDGQEFIAMTALDRVARWDVKSGKLLNEFKAARVFAFNNATPIEWTADTYALINNGSLLDLKSHELVWTYSGGLGIEGKINSRHWYVAGRFGKPSATLESLELPDPNAARLLRSASDPRTDAILKTGTRMSLQLDFGGPPRDGDRYRDQFRAGVETLVRPTAWSSPTTPRFAWSFVSSKRIPARRCNFARCFLEEFRRTDDPAPKPRMSPLARRRRREFSTWAVRISPWSAFRGSSICPPARTIPKRICACNNGKPRKTGRRTFTCRGSSPR